MILVAGLETAGGLGLLLFGGELLLRGAVALARRFGLSKLLIGLTVVAAATSMPELVVVVATGVEGVPDVGVGNVVGSNIANVLLILGVGAIFFPVLTRPSDVLRDGFAVFVASALFVVFALAGQLVWWHGLIMLSLLIGYIGFSYGQERRRNGRAEGESLGQEDEEVGVPTSCLAALLFLALGVAGLVVGSDLLVDGAVTIAHAAGVSDAVIGLTLVAVGTSLPELATAIVAGLRHHTEVALGNVLGSNLFNILAVLSALTFTLPFEVAAELMQVDIWIMLGVSVILLPVMATGWRIGRLEGASFLTLYACYIAWQFHRMPEVAMAG
ncbi:MAG: calcium/sodium antiporter [Kiloniellales bacterium]|nr:calcium/sodium antiporter [Kiloniellales bacterium]